MSSGASAQLKINQNTATAEAAEAQKHQNKIFAILGHSNANWRNISHFHTELFYFPAEPMMATFTPKGAKQEPKWKLAKLYKIRKKMAQLTQRFCSLLILLTTS